MLNSKSIIKNTNLSFNFYVMKEYKIWIYQEWALWSLFLWWWKVNPIKFAEFLNINAREGYRVVTIEREIRRMFLFFNREAMVVVFERDKV